MGSPRQSPCEAMSNRNIIITPGKVSTKRKRGANGSMAGGIDQQITSTQNQTSASETTDKPSEAVTTYESPKRGNQMKQTVNLIYSTTSSVTEDATKCSKPQTSLQGAAYMHGKVKRSTTKIHPTNYNHPWRLYNPSRKIQLLWQSTWTTSHLVSVG